MNSSQMDWEHIGTTRIEQFVEQADAEAHDDKHNDEQKKMEAKEVVTTMVSSAPAAARDAISNLEEEDEGKANIKESEVKSAAAAAHKSEKTARVRPSVLRVLAVFVVTILALGVLALGMVWFAGFFCNRILVAPWVLYAFVRSQDLEPSGLFAVL